MSIEQTRARVTGRVWQAIAQSGVNLAALPADEQTKLVGAITEGLLLEVNTMLDEARPTTPASGEPASGEPATPEGGETVLWEGRPFLSLIERYVLTTERIRIFTGIIGRDIEDIELIRLQDIDIERNFSEKLFNLGDIHLRSADASAPETVLRNVSDPNTVHETIRRAWLDARKRYGFQFREQM